VGGSKPQPRLANGQLVYHILFAFILVPSLFWMIKFWSRLPARYSRGFARVLNFTTPVFNRINALGPRGQAFVFGRKRAGAIFDRIHRSILKKSIRCTVASGRPVCIILADGTPHLATL
jgi:hypothetical protein